MATLRAHAWAGSSRVVWLVAALLLLMALLALLGTAPATRRGSAALNGSALDGSAALATNDPATALRPCSLPDVRVERARSLAATLLPRQLRVAVPQLCAARC
ncbi:MAG: hypothetical protein EOO73_13195 [Myxococcales bacterium]|nr:MAG: hypothetical protein EOO73_13195 [Myxococcales bacterium]